MSTLPKTLTTIVAMSLDDANQSFDPEVRGSILLTGFYILGAIVNLITCLILYPVAWLLSRLLSLVDIVLFRPLLVILRTLAIPFIVVRNLVYAILSIPFRIFDKFEVCPLTFLHSDLSTYVYIYTCSLSHISSMLHRCPTMSNP